MWKKKKIVNYEKKRNEVEELKRKTRVVGDKILKP
jgi:hypothetical protein